MSEGMQKLKELGAQKIHETTYIKKHYVQAMLHESFEGMSRIHFLGFVSILEKEYDVNLDTLKAKAEKYFSDNTPGGTQKNKVFVTPKKKKNYSFVYMSIAVIVFVIVAAFTITNFSSQETDKTVQMLQSEIVESPAAVIDIYAQEDLNVTLEDANSSVADINNSSVDFNDTLATQNVVAQEVPVSSKALKVFSSANVWMGYIDLKTDKRYQKTVSGEFALDPERDWLMVFGHGNLTIETHLGKKVFKSKNNLRFSYIGGVLSEITLSEFKTLNKGKEW